MVVVGVGVRLARPLSLPVGDPPVLAKPHDYRDIHLGAGYNPFQNDAARGRGGGIVKIKPKSRIEYRAQVLLTHLLQIAWFR